MKVKYTKEEEWSNIEEIPDECYGILLERINKLNCAGWPKNCKEIYCNGLGLTELYLPDGCENVNCSNNNLTELYLPPACFPSTAHPVKGRSEK